MRDFDKWPHSDGIKCKCEECKEKRIPINKAKAKRYKDKMNLRKEAK